MTKKYTPPFGLLRVSLVINIDVFFAKASVLPFLRCCYGRFAEEIILTFKKVTSRMSSSLSHQPADTELRVLGRAAISAGSVVVHQLNCFATEVHSNSSNAKYHCISRHFTARSISTETQCSRNKKRGTPRSIPHVVRGCNLELNRPCFKNESTSTLRTASSRTRKLRTRNTYRNDAFLPPDSCLRLVDVKLGTPRAID